MRLNGYEIEPGADLRGAYLDGADLRGADLRRAYLDGAHLSRADLRRANLDGAHLSRADLRRADLSRAYLDGADLTAADLRGANLFGANLRGANLRGADLDGANLDGAQGVICAGTDPRGYRFTGHAAADGCRVLAGCRWFTLAEAREHWANNPDALARVALIAAWAEREGI